MSKLEYADDAVLIDADAATATAKVTALAAGSLTDVGLLKRTRIAATSVGLLKRTRIAATSVGLLKRTRIAATSVGLLKRTRIAAMSIGMLKRTHTATTSKGKSSRTRIPAKSVFQQLTKNVRPSTNTYSGYVSMPAVNEQRMAFHEHVQRLCQYASS